MISYSPPTGYSSPIDIGSYTGIDPYSAYHGYHDTHDAHDIHSYHDSHDIHDFPSFSHSDFSSHDHEHHEHDHSAPDASVDVGSDSVPDPMPSQAPTYRRVGKIMRAKRNARQESEIE